MDAPATLDQSKQPGSQPAGPSGGTSSSQPGSIPIVKALTIAIVFALAASVGGWQLGETLRVPETGMATRGGHTGVAVSFYATKNVTTSYAILGAALAFGLGLAGAILSASQSVPRRILGSLTGLLLGAAGGAAVPAILSPIFFANERTADVTLSLLIHLGIWTVIGAASGIAFGIVADSRAVFLRSVVGGITGAAFAALLFDLSGSFLPMALTERPLSQLASTRLAADVLVGVFVAGGMIVTVFQKPRDNTKKHV